jgi:hypothetical protein
VNEDKPTPPKAPGPAGTTPPAEQSREERIAAAKAKAEAIKAQRAAAGSGPAAGSGAAGAAPAAATGGFKAPVASRNPGGAPAVAPKAPKVQAFGTLTQAVEIGCDPGEEPNIVKILGGLGLYKNPLRGVWQLDYRYYAEAVRRLGAAGYEVDGKDYLGRPLAGWAPEARGWTRTN